MQSLDYKRSLIFPRDSKIIVEFVGIGDGILTKRENISRVVLVFHLKSVCL